VVSKACNVIIPRIVKLIIIIIKKECSKILNNPQQGKKTKQFTCNDIDRMKVKEQEEKYALQIFI
jgi:hypothetical protein